MSDAVAIAPLLPAIAQYAISSVSTIATHILKLEDKSKPQADSELETLCIYCHTSTL